jgi:hypothetical protein
MWRIRMESGALFSLKAFPWAPPRASNAKKNPRWVRIESNGYTIVGADVDSEEP